MYTQILDERIIFFDAVEMTDHLNPRYGTEDWVAGRNYTSRQLVCPIGCNEVLATNASTTLVCTITDNYNRPPLSDVDVVERVPGWAATT